MKLRTHRTAVLLAVLAIPSVLFAQAPAGVARVDSDTYFETEPDVFETSPDVAPFDQVSHSTASEFSQFDAPIEESSFWDHPGFQNTSASHGGLLGKSYLRAAYVYNGIENPALASIDTAFDGWDIELNIPIPWLESDSAGLDFFTKYENRQFSGTNTAMAFSASLENHVTTIGTRLFAFPKSRFRPYTSFAAGISNSETRASGTGGTFSEDNDAADFLLNLGFEFDLATNAALRGDFAIGRDDDIEDPMFEGLLILWPHESVFFRGGILVPLTDGLDIGATAGAGVSF